jgi:ABC-type sugar transport system substrate-binding protein
MGQQEVKRRDFVKVAAGTVAGLAVGGLAGYFGAQATAPPPARQALSGEIPIGILHAAPIEVGPEAPAIEMAREDINNFCKEAGLDVRFKFLEENAEESATKAVERAQTLIGQGVKIIVGSEWSSHCKAVLPLVTERKGSITKPELLISISIPTRRLLV